MNWKYVSYIHDVKSSSSIRTVVIMGVRLATFRKIKLEENSSPAHELVIL